MSDISTIADVVKSGLCISCGGCMMADRGYGTLAWRYSNKHHRHVPAVIDDTKGADLAGVCPGRGVELVKFGKSIAGAGVVYDVELGFVRQMFAAQSSDQDLMEHASSGGVMTAIAKYLLASGSVDGVLVTRFSYGLDGPRPESLIARNYAALIEGQGSKYCPVSFHEALMTIAETNDRIAFIGTPCQIEALRLLQERLQWVRDRVVLVIGCFCGGMKDLRELEALIRRQGISLRDVAEFSYRGGGQPGKMTIRTINGDVRSRPYPDYVTDTGYKKLERCRLCVDGTAEMADIACGDAWLGKFRATGRPWSIVIGRSEKGVAVLEKMKRAELLHVESVSAEEVKYSQRSNLASKKYRQAARRRLYQILRRPVPVYDGGFYEKQTSVWLEVKVHFSHSLIGILESLRIYAPFIKIARRIRRTNEFRRT